MKIDVLDLQGKSKEKIDLPKHFSEKLRIDLILRAVLSTQSKNRQPYGTDPMAGKRTSAHYHGYRRHRWTMMNREMARMPRIHGNVSPHLMWRPMFVPQATKGRVAHPPKAEKIWTQKMNKKERQLAIRSAMAASADMDTVLKRGHKFDTSKQLPIIVEDKIQELKKTKDVVQALKNLGLAVELKRTEKKKIRPGKGKMRGRKYKRKIGPLIVVSEDKGIGKAVKNIPGMNICRVQNLCAEYLAPGAMPGRLTIWSKSAIKKMGA